MVSINKYLDVLSKLMDEDINDSERNSLYDAIFDYVHSDFATSLDDGCYTANSEVIKNLDTILSQYTIFNVINELTGKQIVAIRGSFYHIEKALMNSVLGVCKWVRSNTNVPTIVLPRKGKTVTCAITYMNKMIELDMDEYRIITSELYKKNIEIRKLVKCFVVYTSYEYENISLLLLPQYMDNSNDVYEQLENMYETEYLFIDSDGVWEKIVKKVPPKKMAIFFDGNKNFLLSNGRLGSVVELHKCNEINEICKNNNKLTINHNIESKVLNAILDAEIFYANEINLVTQTIERLTKDSLMLEEGKIKSQVITYKGRLLAEKDKLLKGRTSFFHAKENLLEIAKEYENSFSKALLHDLPAEAEASKYIETLLDIFFKYVRAENRDGCEQVLLKLRRANYKYIEACEAYCNHSFGNEISGIVLKNIQSFPSDKWEIAKIKIALNKQLKYKYDDLKSIVDNIGNHFDSGAEFFFMGRKFVDQKKYVEAKENFERALDMNYPKAGQELINLAKKCPECGIDIEELAENLVPEANFHVGCQNLYSQGKYKKGIVNIKMAASKEYVDAVAMVADLLFEECKHISWQEMQNESNIYKVNNVIRLYEFLEKNNKENVTSEKIYILRMGLMYCKLNDYSRAYKYLKNIIEPEAQYECAKMYQYGNGVAKDLKTALKHYEQIKGEYKDSAVQLAKVRKQLSDTNKPKEKSYTPTKSYSSSPSTSSSSSSYCFITTAACLALSAEKDCEELNELRWFRDTHILEHGQDGKDLVDEYYRIGPIVVKLIDEDWNPFAIYEELWEDYIYPSCRFIKKQMWENALEVYINMVRHMCEKYSVPVKIKIKEKYCINVEIADK